MVQTHFLQMQTKMQIKATQYFHFMPSLRRGVLYASFAFLFAACDGNSTVVPDPTPYNFVIPNKFPKPDLPADNPMTVEGIALGRKLFYEPLLSRDGTISCASCHKPPSSFSDPDAISKGVNGVLLKRHSMPLFNVAWTSQFFWDGRANSLEEQALQPVESHSEMDEKWDNVVAKLSAQAQYPPLFERAFKTKIITKELTVKAIAQFERTLVSANTKFDQWLRDEYTMTAQEIEGYSLFYTEKADCFHCHGIAPLMTDQRFHNNGLDEAPQDSGYFKVTKDIFDIGKFRSPSLRNIEYTAPYMHDGRFKTLEEVIAHYNNGVNRSPNLDPLMFDGKKRGLTTSQIQSLIAFLKMLSDPSFLTNPAFQKPTD